MKYNLKSHVLGMSKVLINKAVKIEDYHRDLKLHKEKVNSLLKVIKVRKERKIDDPLYTYKVLFKDKGNKDRTLFLLKQELHNNNNLR